MDKKRTWIERVNDHLNEPDGETFKRGKWRFWFLLLIGLSLLNAIMTALIFGSGSQAAIVSIVLAVGALIGWCTVGTIHYSDSSDSLMAARVSLLDSITLCFVIAHFCGLLWVLGRLMTIQGAEAKYEAQATALNEKLKNVSSDNVKIAEAVAVAARETTKAERLRNDTAYQQRKAAEAGAVLKAPKARPSTVAPSLSTSPVELERPVKPEESSIHFLSKWDAWIRIANFGELILAAVTLIYIRNRSARQNAPYLSGNGPRINFQGVAHSPATVAPLRQPATKIATPVATVAEGQKSAVDALRGHLKVIAFGIPNHWFKVDPIVGGVVIRLCRRESGREVTIKSTRQSNKILSAVNRPDFRERLIDELIHQGFPIEGGAR